MYIIIKIIYKILSKLPLPKVAKIRINDSYHNYIYFKLDKYFHVAYDYINSNKVNMGNNSGIIWILWWQGKNDMPLIVKRCIESIYRHSNGHKIVLINKNNVMNYADIPNYIYEKVNDGNITLTHFSDILRFNLLDKYGGLWIDSTIYCTSNLNNNIFSSLYTSGGYPNDYHQYISAKWTGFLIGGNKHNKIFQFMNAFFQIYWRHNNRLIDYFLIDYALKYVYETNIGKFRNYVNNKAYLNNPHLYALVKLLNLKYNTKTYYNITNDTNLFKLTYKKNFNRRYKTFYQCLISKKI